jgi:hypothetical protein
MKNSFLSEFLEGYEFSLRQKSELDLLREIAGSNYKINRILSRAELVQPDSGIVLQSINAEGMTDSKIELKLLKMFAKDLMYLGAVVDAENRIGQDERKK